jgi:methyl-accepting chemotaxis protein
MIRTYLSFTICGDHYAVNVAKVLEVLQEEHITPVPNAPAYIRGIINFRGDVVPVFETRVRFNLPARDNDDSYNIIVLDVSEGADMFRLAVQISEGANEQSASAEEVSSSIEEMSSSIQQNSDNSISTEKIAVASAQGMMDVNTSAQKSLEAIRQISDKIKIINDIAGKTDILAINAAIEAARAGEQGKGFAVVAAEVRKLAEVSQKAAVEINELSASSLKVTEESGNLMMKIIPEIQKTAQLVKEIAASSNEQRSGSEQITKAVMQFTQVTQQNAAAAEEMSSSSEELASQAELLKETISFFNTGKQIKSPQTTVKQVHKMSKSKPGAVHKALHSNLTGINVNLDTSDKDDKMFENF